MNDPAPSTAVVLGELNKLVDVGSPPAQSHTIWRMLTSILGNDDAEVAIDFAVKNALVHSLDIQGRRSNGQRVESSMWTNPIDGSEMIWIPPGTFYIGQHKDVAHCAGFSLARHPVTNAQFAEFLKATGYEPHSDHPLPEAYLFLWHDGKPDPGLEKHPVVFVSYFDALNYCRWAGMHLPTEWQWEKAARGSDGRTFPWGTVVPRPKRNFAHVRSESTCAVGEHNHVRTPYGCEDLIGNVSEWCHFGQDDEYSVVPASLPGAGPIPIEEGHAAVRGSCFMRQDFNLMASSHRRKLAKFRRNYWTGFRPAFFHPWCPQSS